MNDGLKKKMAKLRLMIRIGKPMLERLKDRARAERTDRSKLIRKAISNLLEVNNGMDTPNKKRV